MGITLISDTNNVYNFNAKHDLGRERKARWRAQKVVVVFPGPKKVRLRKKEK